MSDRNVSRIAVTVLLMSAIVSIAFAPGSAYSSAIVAQVTTTATKTVISNSTAVSILVFTRNVTTTESYSSNITVISTVTTSMLSVSDYTTFGLAAVAGAALIIAIFSLLRHRSSVRAPRLPPPAGSYTGGPGRALICPSCGTSNKPNSSFCRRCQARLR